MFEEALLFSMKYEVGPAFKLDADTKKGLIGTPEQRRKVGYVNDPDDRGGETKFGVAANANPGVDISALDWAGATEIYEQKYWNAGKCDKLPEKVAFAHFDACINHGTKGAAVLLQQALGVTADGNIGPGTLGAVAKLSPEFLVKAMLEKRRAQFKFICMKNPSQSKFLAGWLARCDSIEKALA